jgi:hypothetical protein
MPACVAVSPHLVAHSFGSAVGLLPASFTTRHPYNTLARCTHRVELHVCIISSPMQSYDSRTVCRNSGLLPWCLVLLQVEPELRGPVGDALAAYASISDKQLLSNLYRLTLQKYQKVRHSAVCAVSSSCVWFSGCDSSAWQRICAVRASHLSVTSPCGACNDCVNPSTILQRFLAIMTAFSIRVLLHRATSPVTVSFRM